MRNHRYLAVTVLVLCMLFGAFLFTGASAHAGKVKSFSAEQVVLAPDGTIQHSSDIFASEGKMRLESLAPEGPQNLVIILRQDKGLQYMLNTKAKTYTERPLDEEEFKKALKSHVKEENVKELGTETVNGYKCTKKQMLVTIDFMGRTMTSTSTVWMSDQFDIPLRTRDEDGGMTELRNIEEGKQPAQLFEVPVGYTKVAGMMELFADEEDEGAPAQGQPFQIPDEIRDKLPKDFKMPAIPRQ